MFHDHAGAVNAPTSHRPAVTLPYPLRPYQRQVGRAAASRRSEPHRPSDSIPPTPPRSAKHRRRRVKASLRELARLAGYTVAVLIAATPAQLRAVAAAVRPATGDGNRCGRARRAAEKIIRLTMPVA